jgi:hypothetical protein
MKKLTLLFLLLPFIGLAQDGKHPSKYYKPIHKGYTPIRYFLFNTEFTLTNGCHQTSHSIISIENGLSPDYDDLKNDIAEWVYPNKL